MTTADRLQAHAEYMAAASFGQLRNASAENDVIQTYEEEPTPEAFAAGKLGSAPGVWITGGPLESALGRIDHIAPLVVHSGQSAAAWSAVLAMPVSLDADDFPWAPMGGHRHWANFANQLLNPHTFAQRHIGLSAQQKLQKLLFLIDEDGEELTEISVQSLQQVLRFMRENPDVRIPELTFTARKTFRAEWRGGKHEVVAAEFHADGMITYVILAPDRIRGGYQKSSGVISRESLRGVATAQGVGWWIA
jgi:hypothetical protein